MAWNTFETVVIRGNTVDDPTDTGAGMVEVELALIELRELFDDGELEEYDDTVEINTAVQRRFSFDLLGFHKEAQDPDAEFQDWGDFLKLRRIMRRLPYKWIWRTYQYGADHTSGPVPRAGEDGTNSLWNLSGAGYLDTGEDYPYDPAGILPYPIELSGALDADRDDGGFYSCTFEAVGAVYE